MCSSASTSSGSRRNSRSGAVAVAAVDVVLGKCATTTISTTQKLPTEAAAIIITWSTINIYSHPNKENDNNAKRRQKKPKKQEKTARALEGGV